MNNLLLNEFDEKIHQITPKLPEEGWIRTIRKCLGMTTKQLAKRLGVNR
jgi:DNA-binding transcriptional regulator YiaG